MTFYARSFTTWNVWVSLVTMKSSGNSDKLQLCDKILKLLGSITLSHVRWSPYRPRRLHVRPLMSISSLSQVHFEISLYNVNHI